MYMKRKLSAISYQLSAKSTHSRVACLVSHITPLNQKGVGLLAVIGIVTVVIIGAVVLTTPQIRQSIFPTPQPTPMTSDEPMQQYSEKQLLYLRNKEAIMKSLNLNEEQFKLLVESANKN